MLKNSLDNCKKPIIYSISIAIAYLIIRFSSPTALAVLDGVSVGAMIVFSMGLIKLSTSSGLFDMTKYGLQKFTKSFKTKNHDAPDDEMGTLEDFRNRPVAPSDHMGFIVVGFVELVACFIVAKCIYVAL